MSYIFGGDESGKGDTFGGLSICVVKIYEDEEWKFENFARDSKKLSDKMISRIAPILTKRLEHNFAVKNYFPEEYNKAFERYGSVTKILNNSYEDLLKQLSLRSEDQVIIDKFPGANFEFKNVHVEVRAERFVAVALASIIARYYFLKQIKALESQLGMPLLKGSSNPAINRLLKRIHLRKKLYSFAKMHFRNVKEVFEKNKHRESLLDFF